jgi:hypothetical protein
VDGTLAFAANTSTLFWGLLLASISCKTPIPMKIASSVTVCLAVSQKHPIFKTDKYL